MRHGRPMLISLALAAPLVILLPDAPVAARVEEDTAECVALEGASEGDTAIVNITPTRADGAGFGSVRPEGAPAMYARAAEDRYSSVNFAEGTAPNPNLAMVAVGNDGRICYDSGVADHDVIIDLAALIPAGVVAPVEPSRLFDTRSGTGGAIMAPDTSLCVTVPGADVGDMAVVNITPVLAQGPGFGSLRAQGTTPIYDRPSGDRYSSVNFADGEPANPNLSFVSVGTRSEICYDAGVSFHHVILDLAAIVPGDAVKPSEPERAIDTRESSLVTPGGVVCTDVPGAEPGDVAVVNVTPVQAVGVGFGALFTSGTTPVTDRPAADQYSSVNFAPNTPANPNLGVVEVGSDGQICYNGAGAAHHVILDIASVINADAITAITPTRVLDTRGPAGAIPLEIDVTFIGDSPVIDAYPEYPSFGFGVVHNGYTAVPALNNRETSIEVGTIRGWIVDNGDGTISGEAFLEDRWGGFRGSKSRSSGGSGFVTVYEYYYEGFGVACPEGEENSPPGHYVFQTDIPILISGTTSTQFGETTYQITTTAGVGATPGNPGGVPELETVVDTLDSCAAGYAYCETVLSTQACGNGISLEEVFEQRDQYIIDQLRINETLVENFNVSTRPDFIRVAERTEFQGSVDRDDVTFRVRLGY